MMSRKLVCVTQVEHVRRQYWVSVPESVDDNDIDQLFYEQNISNEKPSNEHYEVNLDIHVGVGPFTQPPEDEIYELEDA